MNLKRWTKSLISFGTLKDLLSSFGVLWLLVEILSFFGNEKLVTFLKNQWWLFLILGIIYSIYNNRPKNYFEHKVNDRDVIIALKICDVFDNNGALVVPINNKFDVDLSGHTKKAKSILNKLLTDFYNGKIEHIKSDIEQKLSNKSDSYLIGKTIEIEQKDKKFYLVANSHKKENSRVESEPQDLVESLIGLWSYISEESAKDDTITIPLLNTGNGRINMRREDVIKEIIVSFLSSLLSSRTTFCEKLIIGIHPKDVYKYNLDIEKLNDFLRSQCNYFQYNNIQRVGIGIE